MIQCAGFLRAETDFFMSDGILPEQRLIFAMDVPDAGQARSLAIELGDSVKFYKLGLELMMGGGYFELLDWLVAQRRAFSWRKATLSPSAKASSCRTSVMSHTFSWTFL